VGIAGLAWHFSEKKRKAANIAGDSAVELDLKSTASATNTNVPMSTSTRAGMGSGSSDMELVWQTNTTENVAANYDKVPPQTAVAYDKVPLEF
jgi:hypothetical protein